MSAGNMTEMTNGPKSSASNLISTRLTLKAWYTRGKDTSLTTLSKLIQHMQPSASWLICMHAYIPTGMLLWMHALVNLLAERYSGFHNRIRHSC
jgi:hypothetical protein